MPCIKLLGIRKNYIVQSGAVIAGAVAGAWVGSGFGLAGGPFGAIAGTVPGAMVGGLLAGLGIRQFAKCPGCGKVFAI